MSVFRRSGGSWVVKFKDAASGRWRQRQFKERSDAEEFDLAAKAAAEKDRPLTVMEAVLAYLGSRKMSRETLFHYEFCVSGHDRRDGTHRRGPAEHLAERFVHTLTRTDLESVRQRCLADGMKAATINHYVRKLYAAFRWCASEDLLRENPWEKYRPLSEGRPAHRSGTMDSLRRVYPLLPEWLQWAVKTALALCLRPGMAELFALRWSAFDWRGRAVDVWMPKVNASKTVYPPDWYWVEAAGRYAAAGAVPDSPVCPCGAGGAAAGHGAYGPAWRAACRRAGVRMQFYAIRHIAASEMLAAGADLAAVAAQLGHRDLTTTGAFYAHALARAQRGAAAALPMVGMVGDGGEKGPDLGH